jgi:DNA recombination protein RmuC
MIGIYIALGVVGVLAVMLLMVILRMFRDQRTRRAEEEKMRQEEKLVQDSIKEKLIKLETLAANPAQAKTLDEINKRLDSTTKLFGEISKGLGQMQETAKGMADVEKSITTFQELLISPKVRGGFGEVLLNELIKDVLPPASYQFQYRFKDRTAVDVVIKAGSHLIPIDSKFPLEDFQRMVNEELTEDQFKQRFKQLMTPRVKEVQKYIKPDEGTLNFALMYIPSEKIYSRLSGMDDLMASFRRIHVFPVSPSTFYQFLETIRLGLRGLEIQENVKRILDTLNRVAKEFDMAKEEWGKVGTHLTNARTQYDKVSKRLDRISDKIDALEVEQEEGQKGIPYEDT